MQPAAPVTRNCALTCIAAVLNVVKKSEAERSRVVLVDVVKRFSDNPDPVPVVVNAIVSVAVDITVLIVTVLSRSE